MKTVLKSAFAALLLAGIAGVAHAGDISLENPWSRAAPTGAPVGAGYVTLKNTGNTGDKLVSATADVAGKVEIHEMAMDNGVMKMRPVHGLEIPAGKSVELKPGGYHIMFMQLKKPLVAGEKVNGTLTFEKAGAVPVEYTIKAMSAGAGGMPGHKSH